ncbi:hypothetical protein SD80_012115 [Scytonema tolypothrichoides VB-61278]|nr:hypothetical protein SD80_012115 [Scytonema tolypothrichoides VB-61278]
MNDPQLSIADLLAKAGFQLQCHPGAELDDHTSDTGQRVEHDTPEQVAVAALKPLRLWYVIAMTESQQQADELRRFRGKM